MSGPAGGPKQSLFRHGLKGFSTLGVEKGRKVQKGSKRTSDGPKGVAKESLGPRFKDIYTPNPLGHCHYSLEPPIVVKRSRSRRIQPKSCEGRLEMFTEDMFGDKRSSLFLPIVSSSSSSSYSSFFD